MRYPGSFSSCMSRYCFKPLSRCRRLLDHEEINCSIFKIKKLIMARGHMWHKLANHGLLGNVVRRGNDHICLLLSPKNSPVFPNFVLTPILSLWSSFPIFSANSSFSSGSSSPPTTWWREKIRWHCFDPKPQEWCLYICLSDSLSVCLSVSPV